MKYGFLILMALTCSLTSTYGQNRKKGGKGKKAVEAPAPAAETPPAPVVAAAPPMSMEERKQDSLRRMDSAVVASGYDPLSVRKVHTSDVMYKMQVWRVLDLREKCNQPFFAKENEITKAIIEEVYAGRLNAYAKDSLTKILSLTEFKDKIIDPSSAQVDAEGNPIPGTGVPFMGKNLYILKFRENLLFDKQRSRFYYDIQTVTLFIPAEFNTIKGTETEVASFRYKDLVEVFRNMPNARWYNGQNRAEDKKVADAMDLRLFCSRIIKISNPKDAMIEDLPEYNTNDRSILMASQRYEYDLVAKENEVWDY
jgi:gliding motility associated protien GldN